MSTGKKRSAPKGRRKKKYTYEQAYQNVKEALKRLDEARAPFVLSKKEKK